MPSGFSAPSGPAPKRRKISESCNVCRQKKTRCDGQRPVCSSCSTKGISCEYSKDSIVAIPASTLASIDARLSTLEQLMSGRTNVEACPPEACTDQDDDSVDNEPSALQQTPANVIIGILKHANHLDTSTARKTLNVSSQETTQVNTNNLKLPDRSDADLLLESYARQVYPVFPILHLPTLRASYERMWPPSQPGNVRLLTNNDVVLYATLNIVMALGRLNKVSIEPRMSREQAKAFYERARGLLTLDAIDSPSLETVQYALLTTQYLLFTSRFNRCHIAIGMAIRAAQSIKLDSGAEINGSQREGEMARRVWHSCILLERLVCSLFGRQVTSFAESTVPLPTPTDDEYLLEDKVDLQPPDRPAIIVAFNITIEIFRIIEDARWIIVPRAHLTLGELTTVLQLNERLDHIQGSLPTHLRNYTKSARGTQEPQDDIFVLQHVAIMIRIAHIRLLLLRSCILEAARQYVSSPVAELDPPRMADRLRLETCHICVRAAIDTIDLLDHNLHAPIRVMSCIALFTAFSAASVLVAASLVPELEEHYELPGTRFSQAINVLTNHRWQIDGVSSAKEQLEQFMKTVKEIKARRGTPTGPAITTVLRDVSTPDTQGDGLFDFDLSDPLWSLDWSSTVELPGF
ncbi:putative transcriptional regulatory protein [Phaeosphaeria sp. MPI-PUGE-AT-0046c]|nr:putative transcriptional regulatory protein [Phaeosphaeria sp. MPI-PUGE-AT-0046c]